MKNVTISDVASRAGVSKGLVSLALNDKPGVATATRERVRQAALDLGWIPSQYARGLSLQMTFTLGLVIRRDPAVLAADPFFPAFIAGVESVLSDKGWSLLLSVAPNAQAERETYRRTSDGRVDGFFLTDLRVNDQRLPLLAELGAEAILVGPPQSGCSFPSVNVADQSGVKTAVEHLVKLDHVRIGYVTGDLKMVHGQSRLEAFKDAVEAAGLPKSMIIEGDFSPHSGAVATRHLMDLEDPPTAIIYASDPMAVASLGALQSLNIDVPGEVSIIGFDGVELGQYLHPPLTTVRTDPYQWGKAAAEMLLTRLSAAPHDGQVADVHHVLPAAELLVRDSTRPPRK